MQMPGTLAVRHMNSRKISPQSRSLSVSFSGNQIMIQEQTTLDHSNTRLVRYSDPHTTPVLFGLVLNLTILISSLLLNLAESAPLRPTLSPPPSFSPTALTSFAPGSPPPKASICSRTISITP